MSRLPDVHDRFAAWLATRPADATEDAPRDLALHAAGCDACLRSADAFDTLSAIDVAAAPMPPVRIVVGRQVQRPVPLARYVVAAAALALATGAVVIGSGWLNGPPPTDGGGQLAPQGEGVLAGAPFGEALEATPTPSAREIPDPSVTASQRPSPSVPAVTPTPPQAVRPVLPAPTAAPLATQPPPSALAPTATPTPTPTTAPSVTVAPTPAPTATPTATALPTAPPTPLPTPSPVPSLPFPSP